ncbi:MAG TPA: hypothetical protein VI837_04200 [Blastocatellia bacterium]|nr:hypothetical protein [Blastocatellia bacterium]
MMKTIAKLGSIVAAFTLLSTLALAAPRAERSNKYFKVAGTVLQIDNKDRTLLVTDRLSNKLYLIEVPEAVTFKITFGRYMRMAEPGFDDVKIGERVEIRCTRGDTEHLARLDDGRSVVTLTAAR